MSNEDWQNAYDDSEDIKENQGYVPTWFSWLFYGSIVIGIIYGVSYHFVAKWSQDREYRQEVIEYQKQHPVVHVKLNDDGSNPYRGDTAAIAAGKKTFQAICAACHKADGTGLIGPNVVDNEWLHGSTDKVVYDGIMEGIPMEETKLKPSKGPMPAHKNSLGAKKVLETMAWLASKNSSLKAK